MRKLLLLLILSCIVVAPQTNPPAAQSCTCQPASWGALQNGQTVNFATGSLGSSASEFFTAMNEWENALNLGNFSVNMELGSTNPWVVTFDDSISGWGITDFPTRTIRLHPSVLSWSGFFFRVALHEIGHVVGLHDNYDANCNDSSTIMKQGWSGGGGTSVVTSADQCALHDQYYIRDESPILIDLDGGSIQLTAPEVLFDLAATGIPRHFGWTPSESGDAFLVMDRDGDEMITSGREMFGNFTPLSWNNTGDVATHGFEALAYFDEPVEGGDGNGYITNVDRVFPLLHAWVDINHDGVSQSTELRSLPEVGVVALDTVAQRSERQDPHGNRFRYRAKVLMLNNQGHVIERFAYDVFLATF